MRAGNLDRRIIIEEPTITLDEYRATVKTWQKLAAIKAQIVEHDRSDGEGVRVTTDAEITFRIYWLQGVTLEHRVVYEGEAYTIKKVREIGRRTAVDIVCERVGP